MLSTFLWEETGKPTRVDKLFSPQFGMNILWKYPNITSDWYEMNLAIVIKTSLFFHFFSDRNIPASQPEFRRFNIPEMESVGNNEEKDGNTGGIWFSQPVHLDHMLLCSQSPSTQNSQLSQLSQVTISCVYTRQVSLKPVRGIGG